MLKLVPISKRKVKEDSIHVNLTRKKISGSFICYCYRDKDTRQMIYYAPSFDLTGYGSSDEKALEMLKFSLNEYFRFLSKLNLKEIRQELKSLGWEQNSFKKKDFSKVYVDENGNLKNFNAVGDKVEACILTM